MGIELKTLIEDTCRQFERMRWSPSAGQESGSAKRDSSPIDIPGPYPERSTYISTFSSESESPFFLPLLLK